MCWQACPAQAQLVPLHPWGPSGRRNERCRKQLSGRPDWVTHHTRAGHKTLSLRTWNKVWPNRAPLGREPRTTCSGQRPTVPLQVFQRDVCRRRLRPCCGFGSVTVVATASWALPALDAAGAPASPEHPGIAAAVPVRLAAFLRRSLKRCSRGRTPCEVVQFLSGLLAWLH
eukprot:scaffold3052_cov389-Prasinococcus_capsulatus_cf.AAC.21